MKSLNRTLSLVLVLVMVFGLFGVASAAYTDTATIKNAEAVQTMSALNIIQGNPDGSFNPTGIVTRAEMAKMICVALNGGKAPVLGTNAKPTFTDIKGHWGESYIEYCVNLGIVAGMGDGTFQPDATVTGSQAAKMMLVAMNYDAKIFEFTGAAWELNVNVSANKAGIYTSLGSINASAGLTRDNAAQLIYNGINAGIMELQWSQDMATGKVTQTYQLNSNKTIASEKFGLKKFVGIMMGDTNALDLTKADQIKVYGAVGTNTSAFNTFTYKMANANDLIGEIVCVFFKDGANGTSNTVDDTDTIYGIVNTGKSTVYTISKAQMQDSDKLADGKIKFGDKYYSVASFAATNVTDYNVVNYNLGQSVVTADGIDALADNNNTLTSAELATYLNNLRLPSTDKIKFICDSNGKINFAYVTNTSVAKVASVTSTAIQLEGLAGKKLEDCVNTTGIVTGDIVRFATMYGSNCEVTSFMGKCSTVEGIITAFNATGSQVKIADTWYANNMANTFTVSGYTDGALAAADVGKTVSLVLDGPLYGAYKVVSGTNAYGLITWANDNMGVQTAKLLTGENKTCVVTAATGTTIADNAGGTAATLFPYGLSSENTKVTLGTVATAVTDNVGATVTHAFVKNNLTLVVGANATDTVSATKIVASDAIVYIYNSTTTTWKAFKASEVNSFAATNNTILQYIEKDGKVVAFAAQLAGYPTGATTTTGFGYVTGVIATLNGTSPATQLTIWNGKENVTVLVDGAATAQKGDYVKYPTVSAATVVNDTDVPVETSGLLTYTDVKIKELDTANGILISTTDKIGSDGKVIAGTDSSCVLTADTKIIGVDSANKKGSTVAAAIPYSHVYGSDFKNAVIVTETVNSLQVVRAIFVDENNKIFGTAGTASALATEYTVTLAAVVGAATLDDGVTVTANKTKGIEGEVITVTVKYDGTATSTAATVACTGTGGVVVTSPADVTVAPPTAETFVFQVALGAGNTTITITMT